MVHGGEFETPVIRGFRTVHGAAASTDTMDGIPGRPRIGVRLLHVACSWVDRRCTASAPGQDARRAGTARKKVIIHKTGRRQTAACIKIRIENLAFGAFFTQLSQTRVGNHVLVTQSSSTRLKSALSVRRL